MMTKQEKILWGLFAGILVFLYLLSSTDLIIKEKKTEIYPISIIIGDTSDDYYVNFRKGVDQAALDYNADVSFITLFERYDAVHQLNLVKREIEDGAKAVILAPVAAAECAKLLDETVLGSPLIMAGNLLPNEQVKNGISMDYYEAGKKLGEAVAERHGGGLPVYIFAEKLGYGYNQDLYDGLMTVLEEKGFRTTVCQKEKGDTFQSVIERTVYPGSGRAVIVALDPPSTDAAVDIIGGSPVYGSYIEGLYGIGGTPRLLSMLDKGVIQGLVVDNQFEEGYLCVEKAVEAIRRNGEREQITLESYYIERQDLREREFEKILYPID